MVASLIVLVVALPASVYFIFSKRLARSKDWAATVTPLASIIGSGFLVCAPLLADDIGYYAVFGMAALLLLAYAIGSALRFNILHTEKLLQEPVSSSDRPQSTQAQNPSQSPVEPSTKKTSNHSLFIGHSWRARLIPHPFSDGLLRKTETLSHGVLIIAYLISVTYYLQLLAVFSLRAFTPNPDETLTSIITTVILAGITAIGFTKGLEMLERIEHYVVGLKLAMITSLTAGLLWHNGWLASTGDWHLPSMPEEHQPWRTVRFLMGMLIVVQGFETSLFLGSRHSPEQRIRTMRRAQIISAIIYIAFLTSATVLFDSIGDSSPSEVTAVIDMAKIVSPVLPILLIVMSLSSQFSAAVADDAGCGGLIETMSRKKIPSRYAYLFIGVLTIALTWVTNVTEIISLASRAFAVFYALQCLVATIAAYKAHAVTYRKVRIAFYLLLSLICAAVALLGIPAE